MNVRQVVFLLIACIGFWTFSLPVEAQQVQIKGPKNGNAELSGSTYGPIAPEDTLWRIANRYRQNRNLSVYQVMQAIYDLNPDAFEDQNFNHIKDGVILNLPSERYVARIDPEQARLKAEQDDINWQTVTGGKSNKIVSLKSSAAASKDDLSETKQLIEQKISALDVEQNRQFMAIRQQFAESIQGVQSLLNENRKLVERLDVVDQEIGNLRGRVDEELQVQMDQMLALQNELLSISREAEMQRKAEAESGDFKWLTDPIFLIFLSVLLVISFLGAFAMWLIRRNRTSSAAETSLGDPEHLAILEQSDEMDDLADALASELSDEVDETDEDDLFADEELLDDVLSNELEESLDSAIDNEFDDLDDESLDPIIQDDNEPDDDDGLLDQDDLDNIFDEDEDEDEDDLLAEIETDLDDVDDLESEFEAANNEDQIDDVEEDVIAELGDEIDSLSDEDIDNMLDESNERAATPEQGITDDIDLNVPANSAQTDVATDDDQQPEEQEVPAVFEEPISEQEKPAAAITPSTVLDDEPDKPEISIDDLLEQPLVDLEESIITDNADIMNEDMLQNLDKEIAIQNVKIDNIADELLNEIDQLAQMGGVLDEYDSQDYDEDEEQDDQAVVSQSDSQMGIQTLDAISDGLDDYDIDAQDEDDVLLEDPTFPDPNEHQSFTEIEQPKPEAVQTEDVNAEQIEQQSDHLSKQQTVSDDSIESLSADELLAEIDGEKIGGDTDENDPSNLVDTPTFDTEPDVAAETDTEIEIVTAEQNDEDITQFSELKNSQLDQELDQLGSETDEQEEEQDRQDDDIEDLDKALDEFEQEVDSQSTEFETTDPLQTDANETQAEQVKQHESEAFETSEIDDDIPSIDDLDSLIGSEKDELDDDEFDDDELDEALKAFDENLDPEDLPTEPLAQNGSTDSDVELEDLPGLGDWLSSEEAEENTSIDELEKTSFDELLESIDEPDESEDEALIQELDESGLDINALLNEPESEDQETGDFLDVEDLINESINAESSVPLDKELNLDAALESYAGISDAQQIDVDSDNGIGGKFDLAQAYIETEDFDAAKELLKEIIDIGDESQQKEATALLDKLNI
jgi:pilus assembly protein FimV